MDYSIRITLFIILLFYVSSLAQAGEYSIALKKVSDLYENMEYEKCLEAINELELLKSDMSKDEVIELYKFKAFIYILSDKKALAENAIKEIYKIEPDFMLSASVSPKLREVFSRVKKELEEEGALRRRVIKAESVKSDQEGEGIVLKVDKAKEEGDNFFKKNIIPIGLLTTGIVLMVPGVIVRVGAASDAEDYRKELKYAPKDEDGRIIGIKEEEVQKRQDEINKDVMIGNTLIGIGTLGLIGGVVSYFLVDNKGEENKGDGKFSFMINGDGFFVKRAFDF